ncbi:DUF4118 domain-containing protein [Streptomyces sp. NRRL F-4489]|uniref:DUF4118 domain-containing protein n=1 Tax=Streptomyces sp. NRRL F-4489 TaxID=1609095 RepID=UPI000A50560B|nr:DUF4118 domain-containing protein [Streptomyces sp. NRRL F-4489]
MATLQHPPTPPALAPVRAPAASAAPRRERPARPPDDLGRDLALPVGAAAAAVVATALLATGRAAPLPFALAAFALLTVAVAAAARLRLVPAVVLVSWMFFDGFVVHQRAELAWGQADRTSLWALAAAGLAGAACAGAARTARTLRARREAARRP